MNTIIVIPARMNSSRLKSKPVRNIGGKPLIQHCYENAVRSGILTVVAGDKELYNYIETAKEESAACGGGFSYPELPKMVVVDDPNCFNGTERVAKAVQLISNLSTPGNSQITDDTIVVNVQGDNYNLPELQICRVAEKARELAKEGQKSTVVTSHTSLKGDEYGNRNCVKIMVNYNHQAYGFFRGGVSIPDKEDPAAVGIFKHIGIYAYRYGFLKKYAEHVAEILDDEFTQSLEQLRIWKIGGSICSVWCEKAVKSIDTFDDLSEANRIALAEKAI